MLTQQLFYIYIYIDIRLWRPILILKYKNEKERAQNNDATKNSFRLHDSMAITNDFSKT